jgi:pilus assembly protein CpaC
MIMNSNFHLTRPAAKAGLFLASLLTAAALAIGVQSATATRAVASDLDVSAAEDLNDSRFVRIGLNKSIVIKLPAEARDVIVGNPDVVDAVVRSKNTAYLFARRTGQTNIFFFDASGQQILSLDLEVAQDTTAIKKLLQRSLPGTRITVDTANDNIILGGIAQNALEAKTAVDLATQFTAGAAPVINTIKVAGEDQVMLKVKIVEIQRDVLKQLGVDLQAMIDAGGLAFNLANINPFASDLLSPNGGYKAVATFGGSSVQGLVRAMESDGLLRTLAEPNLTAQTGTSANFLAGGEFPFCRTRTNAGCDSFEYKPFGVAVDFTPVVLEEGRINLKIKTEVSEISQSTSGLSVPSINTRRAESTLELPSGGSMMIAGLIRESTRQYIKGTPGMKKLPVLGTLFRSRDFIANETELVIIVTPYLVRHSSENQMTTPDKNYNTPTDRQTIFMGRLNKVYGVGGKTPEGEYTGSVGFIVE